MRSICSTYMLWGRGNRTRLRERIEAGEAGEDRRRSGRVLKREQKVTAVPREGRVEIARRSKAGTEAARKRRG
jgi:hypothetical protein